MAYNLTNISSSTNPFELFQSINQASTGWLAIMVLVVVWIITIMAFKKMEQDTKKIILFSSFAVAVLSVFFQAVGLVGPKFTALPIVGVIAGFILVYFDTPL